MELLVFLVLGTLIFGFVFPAFILIAALLLLIFAIIALFSMFTGLFGGKRVIIYKNGRRVDTAGKTNNKRSTADNPEVIANDDYAANKDVYDFGDQAEPEIVELPASALSKDECEEKEG